MSVCLSVTMRDHAESGTAAGESSARGSAWSGVQTYTISVTLKLVRDSLSLGKWLGRPAAARGLSTDFLTVTNLAGAPHGHTDSQWMT